MSQWWAVPMLLSGGLFVGGVVAIAWERVPAWRATDPVDFRSGFAHTLRQLDRLQPALLVVCLGSTIGFASSTGGAARTLATLAAGGLLVVLVGSVAWLVPIQRRLVASGPPPLSAGEALCARWCGGHLVRSAVALAGFVLAVVATPRAGRPIRELPELGTVEGCGRPRLGAGGLVHRPPPQLDRSAPVQGAGQVTDPSAAQDHPGAPGIDSDRPAPDRRRSATPREGEAVMIGKRLFTLNGVIAGGYGLALLVAAGPILDLYGITPNPEGVYMARWFGLELLAIGLVTWLARDAAASAGGRAIARALAVTYAIGVVLAIWGTLFGPFNTLGWIAVGLNLGLGAGFAWLLSSKPRTTSATPT